MRSDFLDLVYRAMDAVATGRTQAAMLHLHKLKSLAIDAEPIPSATKEKKKRAKLAAILRGEQTEAGR